MSSAFSRAAASSPSPAAHADEEGAELAPQVAQRFQVVAGHSGAEVLPVGDQGAQPVQVGQPVAVLAPAAGCSRAVPRVRRKN